MARRRPPRESHLFRADPPRSPATRRPCDSLTARRGLEITDYCRRERSSATTFDRGVDAAGNLANVG